MHNLAEVFNRSGFSRFINSLAGRIFRLAAGLVFLVVGYVYRDNALGDICYISALLSGPLSGAKIRDRYKIG
jgi:hypothetical protein